MPNIPVLTARKLIKILKKKGFVHDRSDGSHQIYIHEQKKLTVSVPVHPGHDLGKGITLSILKSAGISPDDIQRLK